MTYLNEMWNDRGFRAERSDRAADTVVAHTMVESFVNAFARDGQYAVTFNDSVVTAGTEMKRRKVQITPAPIADATIDAATAGQILTGLAVHEISHPRYGKRTHQAVAKAFPHNNVASVLSNVLDDVRIERRFVADYPGYAGIFDTTLNYIGESTTRDGLNKPTPSDPVNFAIASIRFPAFAEWNPADASEREWWSDWSERGAKADRPMDHVAFIREALQHIADNKPAPKAKPEQPKNDDQPQGPGGSEPQQSAGESRPEESDDDDAPTQDTPAPSDDDAGEDDPTTDHSPVESPSSDEYSADDADGSGDPAPAPMNDAELNDATRTENADSELPDCSGSEAVRDAARANGASSYDIQDLEDNAGQMIEDARSNEDDGTGRKVDVAWSSKGIARKSNIRGEEPKPSPEAIRAINSAMARSRTGNTDTNSYQRRGRIDARGLHRIAMNDTRVFEKRTAPSPGKYNVYVMVDCSGSMAGAPLNQAAQVAHAIAAASNTNRSVRTSVWGWSDPMRNRRSWSAFAGVCRVWETGMRADEALKLAQLPLGGTPDTSSFRWAVLSAIKTARTGETPVVIMISDGCGMSGMAEAVADARRRGVIVKGVSFGKWFDADAMTERYGAGNFVEFNGSVTATARPLGRMMADVTQQRKAR